MNITILRKIVFTVLLMACLVSCTARRGEEVQSRYNADPIAVSVPRNLEQARVRDIVEYTLNRRRWVVVESSTDHVLATLNHRGIKGKVRAEIGGNIIKLMDYSTDLSGDKIIALGWVEVLEKDLNKNFQRVMRKDIKDIL